MTMFQIQFVPPARAGTVVLIAVSLDFRYRPALVEDPDLLIFGNRKSESRTSDLAISDNRVKPLSQAPAGSRPRAPEMLFI
jgi:hypothetical protein